MKLRSSFIKNILYAFLAQGIALSLSIFTSLIVPKVLGVAQYSYWQLFLFYVSYVGLFHFGLDDGVYLRLGGMAYDKLDYRELAGELQVLFYIELAISMLLSVGIICSDIIFERKYVIICTAFYLVITNVSMFLGYIFQAVNLTKLYSISVIIDRIIILISFAVLIHLKVADFYIYVACYTISRFSSLLYCLVKGKKIIFAKTPPLNSSLKCVKRDILTDINLTIANLAGSLILGVGRIIVDRRWGIESFGKFSFSLSMTNFFSALCQPGKHGFVPCLKADQQRKNEIFLYKDAFFCKSFAPMRIFGVYPTEAFLTSLASRI